MNCDDIKIMIYEYLDGELPKEKEAFLFTHMANCVKCREEFKQQNLIKHTVQINQKEVSVKFEERLFKAVAGTKMKSMAPVSGIGIKTRVSYAVAVLLLVTSIILFSEGAGYKQQLQNVSYRIEEQNKLIKALFNSIPFDENAVNVQKPIIVSAKM
jgi:predicted anti-sigma-YlaC factor YlaD